MRRLRLHTTCRGVSYLAMNERTARNVIEKTMFAISGVLVQDGLAGQVIVSLDEENPVKMTGKDLLRYGFNVIRLIEEEYIYPVTNQDAIEQAMQIVKKARETEPKVKSVERKRRVKASKPNANQE